jgi:hypothetical protein
VTALDPRKEFGPTLKRVIDEELGDIDPNFKTDVMRILCARGFNQEKIMKDMHLYYPFWLSGSFGVPWMDDAINELTRFNFWFGLHALAQDDLLDQRKPDDDLIGNILFSDYFLFKALTHLNKLTKMLECKTTTCIETACKIDIIAKTKDLYEDYINCILWEKRRSNLSGPYTEEDIRNLGEKFSVLKINNVFLGFLTDKSYLVEKLDAFLEDYHICMQIIDDINDWKSDLENENLSYVLSYLKYEYRYPLRIEDLDKLDVQMAYSGTLEIVSEKALEYLQLAQSNIECINNPYLIELVAESENVIRSIVTDHVQAINALLMYIERRLNDACDQA